MNFTFGIITSNETRSFLPAIIGSILDQDDITKHNEIIIIGLDYSIDCIGRNDIPIKSYSFDESIRQGWITAKKNKIVQYAKYDNIVFMHDYIQLQPFWYRYFNKWDSTNEWDVAMNVILNNDGSRFRDWCTWNDPDYPPYADKQYGLYLADYENYCKPEFMYVSGAYWVAKKEVMKKYPLDDNLTWGQGEDVEWSKRCLPNVRYRMNPLSCVKLLKQKDPVAIRWSERPKPNPDCKHENLNKNGRGEYWCGDCGAYPIYAWHG